MEAAHSLIIQIKAWDAGILLRSKTQTRSHSSGSILGAGLAQTHPDDLDALVYTGYQTGGANNEGDVPFYHYPPAAIQGINPFPHDSRLRLSPYNHRIQPHQCLILLRPLRPLDPSSRLLDCRKSTSTQRLQPRSGNAAQVQWQEACSDRAERPGRLQLHVRGAMCIQIHEDVGVKAVLSGTTGFELYRSPTQT